jgi:hypothetical protein
LIERNPADIWLWVFWVKAWFLLLAVCMLLSALLVMPFYALSEGVAWFRFPLFAATAVVWLGTDNRLLYAMLQSPALGMFLMTGILTAEMIIEGQKGGRLSWS